MSERLLSLFVLLVNVAIPLASFVTGLRSTDPLWLWKRPRLLGRALLSILLVVPFLTVVLVEVLSPAGPVEVSAGSSSSDIRAGAVFTVTGQACPIKGEDRAFLSVATVSSPSSVQSGR